MYKFKSIFIGVTSEKRGPNIVAPTTGSAKVVDQKLLELLLTGKTQQLLSNRNPIFEPN